MESESPKKTSQEFSKKASPVTTEEQIKSLPESVYICAKQLWIAYIIRFGLNPILKKEQKYI